MGKGDIILYLDLLPLIVEEHVPSETDPASTLDFHVRAKERQLQNVLSQEDEAEGELRRALAKHGQSASDAMKDPTVDALYTQLALLDLPTAAATELLPPDDMRTRGLLSDTLVNLKTAGRRLFHVYSEALHTFICEKAGADLRDQVLSAISAGTGSRS